MALAKCNKNSSGKELIKRNGKREVREPANMFTSP